MERYTREESVIAYWGMGLHWGPMKSNNKKGHLIGAAPSTPLLQETCTNTLCKLPLHLNSERRGGSCLVYRV